MINIKSRAMEINFEKKDQLEDLKTTQIELLKVKKKNTLKNWLPELGWRLEIARKKINEPEDSLSVIIQNVAERQRWKIGNRGHIEKPNAGHKGIAKGEE